jgi:transcriptional regulator with XRE-family HTH domain
VYIERVINYFNAPFSMPRPLMFAATAPALVAEIARTLGSRIRLARMRRRVSLRELAERAGVNHKTAAAVEAGNLLTGIGAYLALIWALGLELEVMSLLNPDHDEEGKQRELARTPKRARAKKGSSDADF